MRKNVPYNIENPSAEELLAFLKGNMDTSDTKKMEQDMENDPMLADALSGLREMKSPEKLLSIQQSLQTKIATQLIDNKGIIKETPKKIWQFSPTYYAAAASVILILGFSFFFYKQTQDAKDIFNKNYAPAIVTPEMTDVYTPAKEKEAKTAKITEDAIISENSDKSKIEEKFAQKPSEESQKVIEIPKVVEEKANGFSKKGSDIATKGEMKDFSPLNSPSDEMDKEELKKKWEQVTQPSASVEANKPLPPPAPMPAKEPSYNYNKAGDSKSPIATKPTAPLPAPPATSNMSNSNIPSLSQSKEKEQIAMVESKKSSPKLVEKYVPKVKKERMKTIEQKVEAESAKGEDIMADEVKVEKENDVVNDIYLSGISKYEAKDYAAALAEFKKIPKNHSYRTNADYFSANCYLSLNKQQEAIHLLKPLAEKANWNYQADAKWYLGMAYLGNGQKKKAEEVFLKLLEEGGGTRKAEIEKILKEMGTISK